jgi:hypothetical protein
MVFLGFCYPKVVLPLNSFSKGFHFITKIVVFDFFIALINFGNFLCGCKILINFIGFVGKHIFIHPRLCVVWGHWANFIMNNLSVGHMMHFWSKLMENTDGEGKLKMHNLKGIDCHFLKFKRNCT